MASPTPAKNFHFWSVLTRANLEAECLWDVIENGPSNDNGTNLKDKRAKFIILKSLGSCEFNCLVENLHGDINTELTARDIWCFLCETY